MPGKTSKGRKIGRNSSWCKSYRSGDREKINRKRRMRTTIRHQPNNAQVLEAYEKEFGGYQTEKPPCPKAERKAARA